MSTLDEKQQIEIDYWKNSTNESPEADSISNLIMKVSSGGVLLECLKRNQKNLKKEGRVLELGGGQGWAACIYKRCYPGVEMITTDISEYAVMSVHKWEKIYNVSLDGAYACKSNEINERESSIDLVFCFAAAHHFLTHRRTLKEIFRVLKPGGKAIYFNEPSTSRLFHPLAYKRVNSKRSAVPEDVLKTKKLNEIAREVGFNFEVDYFPHMLNRGSIESLYYLTLSKFTILQRMLPCTANFIFTKPIIDKN